MVRPGAGKLALIGEARRNAAWVERSELAPDLVVHSNDDVPNAAAPIEPVPPLDARLDEAPRRDRYVISAFGLSVGAHLLLGAGLYGLMQQPVVTPPMVPIEIVFADAPGDVVVEDAGKPIPEQKAETPVAEPPPVVEPPPQTVAQVPELPTPEPVPPPPVAEVPPEPPPPEPEPIPEIAKAPEPPPAPEPEPTPEIVKALEPPPPPPEIKVETPPEPKIEPRPRPPRPRPVKLVEPKPVPLVVAPPPPTETPREETAPSKADSGQETMEKEADTAPTAPIVNPSKAPQEAAVPVVNNPRFRRAPTPPRYPPRAREMDQQGTVILRALIMPDGHTGEITVWKTSGHSLLDDAARRAAENWAFEPARIDGRTVAAWVEFPINFKLH